MVKKTTKKAVSQKIQNKISSSKTKSPKIAKKTAEVKNVLKDAPVEQYFILCNGQPVKNVKELAEVVDDLRDEVFNHHVTMDKNDFAKWVSDVFKEVELAEELSGVKDKTHTKLILYKHIVKKLTE